MGSRPAHLLLQEKRRKVRHVYMQPNVGICRLPRAEHDLPFMHARHAGKTKQICDRHSCCLRRFTSSDEHVMLELSSASTCIRPAMHMRNCARPLHVSQGSLSLPLSLRPSPSPL